MTETSVQQRYEEALASFVEKVRQDRYIIAAILCGSLSYDEVWEKSDIDILLIGKEEKKPVQDFYLVENGINIHALLFPRSKFKGRLEGALQSSFFHSFFSKSTLLFSTDETIQEYYENIQHIGARDREVQLLKSATWVLPTLAKAEKWFYVKKDLAYSALYILYMVDRLATIEVLLNGEVASREVVQQALKHNPEFFNAIYVDFIQGPKTEQTIGRALQLINAYLDDRLLLLFKPILEFLSDVGGARSTTELDEYFKNKVQTESLAVAYEWLADKEIIQKVSAPLRLTEKSQVTVDEAAYYYDGT
jgi:predicted nucleotidyltransferase